MKRRLVAVAAMLFLGCAFVLGGVQAQEQEEPARVKLGKPAPAFTLTDSTGQERSLGDCKGKIVVLEWTDPRCVFVQQCYRARAMQTAWQKVRELEGSLVWLAINSTAGAAPQENDFWIRQHGLAYPILLDAEGETAKRYDVRKAPTMFVIDKEGVLRYHGAIDNNQMMDKSGDAITNYVVNAVRQIVDGESVTPDNVTPYGCSVKFRK